MVSRQPRQPADRASAARATALPGTIARRRLRHRRSAGEIGARSPAVADRPRCPDAEPCAAARAKSRRPVCAGSANALPFADRSLAAIFSADVLCHRNVDERAALAGFHRRSPRPAACWCSTCRPITGCCRRMTARVTTSAARHERRVCGLLRHAGFARIRRPIGTASSLPADGAPPARGQAPERRQRRQAISRRDRDRLQRHHAVREQPARARPAASLRRFDPGNGDQVMTRHDFTLSIVIPVYNGAKTIGELVGALAALNMPGGHEIVLVNDGSPDDSLAGLPRPAAQAPGAADGGQPGAQFRRAQCRHGRPARGARRLGHHHGRRSAEPAGRGAAPARIRAEHRQGGGLYLVRHQGARRLAQSRQPLHQPRRRPAARQAQGALSLELPLHQRLRRRARYALCRTVSLYRRSRPPGDAEHRPHRGQASAARRGPQQLHAAPAGAAVAQHVRQFLGDAAAAQHPDRHRHQPVRRRRHRPRLHRGDVLQHAAGLGLDHGGGAAALGRAAAHPRPRRRISRPALSDDQRQAAIDRRDGRAQHAAAQGPGPTPPAGADIEQLSVRRA